MGGGAGMWYARPAGHSTTCRCRTGDQQQQQQQQQQRGPPVETGHSQPALLDAAYSTRAQQQQPPAVHPLLHFCASRRALLSFSLLISLSAYKQLFPVPATFMNYTHMSCYDRRLAMSQCCTRKETLGEYHTSMSGGAYKCSQKCQDARLRPGKRATPPPLCKPRHAHTAVAAIPSPSIANAHPTARPGALRRSPLPASLYTSATQH
ncbi:hypothetical protein BDZ91DRAFT_111956 [Kalaharituber pfeilii]|nr:hypothetical protein BDZ91DRAFT_111956 [Kalaharituber pfeilii]